jgi:hypothetical protein
MLVAALALLGCTVAASAQAPQSQTLPPASSGTPAPTTPRVDCRAQAEAKGLKGQERRDTIAICVAEQRLACVKEAVARKIVGKERRAFVRSCAGRPGARDRRRGRDKDKG